MWYVEMGNAKGHWESISYPGNDKRWSLHGFIQSNEMSCYILWVKVGYIKRNIGNESGQVPRSSSNTKWTTRMLGHFGLQQNHEECFQCYRVAHRHRRSDFFFWVQKLFPLSVCVLVLTNNVHICNKTVNNESESPNLTGKRRCNISHDLSYLKYKTPFWLTGKSYCNDDLLCFKK